MEEKAIIELYLARREEAITQTQKQYGRRLRRISDGIVDDAQTAEECENDTYLQAWNRIPPSQPYGYLFPFLARIIRHISIDVCRSRGRLKRDAVVVELTRELEQCIPSGHDPAAEVDHILLGELISRYLHSLPPEKRNIFIRRYWYLDSVRLIAARFGIGESRVKIVLYRCRKELRQLLEKEGFCL